MADELLYRGYTIKAEPCRLEAGGWTLEGVLVQTGNPRPRQVRFYLGGTTPSREAAVGLIFDEGKRLIDLRTT